MRYLLKVELLPYNHGTENGWRQNSPSALVDFDFFLIETRCMSKGVVTSYSTCSVNRAEVLKESGVPCHLLGYTDTHYQYKLPYTWNICPALLWNLLITYTWRKWCLKAAGIFLRVSNTPVIPYLYQGHVNIQTLFTIT